MCNLFACTTIPILHDWALKYFDSSSTLSSFLLVAISLPCLVASSPMSFNLFAIDHVCKTLNPCRFVRLICFVYLLALSPILKGVDAFINTFGFFRCVFLFFRAFFTPSSCPFPCSNLTTMSTMRWVKMH